RLCSAKLRSILESNAGVADMLQWLEIAVCGLGEKRTYHILHFPAPPDVLDHDKTLYQPKHVVLKPVLSQEKAKSHHVFTYPQAGGLKLFVSRRVRTAIRTGACTGIQFTTMPTA